MRAVCRCVVIGRKRGVEETWMPPTRRMLSSQKFPLHSLSLRLLVQAQLWQHPRHRAARVHLGFQLRGSPLGMGVPNSDGLLEHVTYELSLQCVGLRALHAGPLHAGGTQSRRTLLQYSWLRQLVARRCSLVLHLVINPLCEPPANRPSLMGFGRAGSKVRRRFGLCFIEEARGI